ncbi:MAG: hypothetical protein WC242_00920 [Candidatus Paceibacterota bacterium]
MKTRVVEAFMGKKESAKNRKRDMIVDCIAILTSLVVFIANQRFHWSPRVLFGVLILCMGACFIQFVILLLNPNIQYTKSVVMEVKNGPEAS